MKIGRPLRNAQQKRKRKHLGSQQLQCSSFWNFMVVLVLVDGGMSVWGRSEVRVVAMLLVKRVLFF
jgi:hypothetical protein